MKRNPEAGNIQSGDEKGKCSKSVLVGGITFSVLLAVLVVVIIAVELTDDGSGKSTECDIPFVSDNVNNLMTWVGHNARHILGMTVVDDSTVWDEMDTWQPMSPISPPMGTKAFINMYMWDNEMYMVNTQFSATSSLRALEEDSDAKPASLPETAGVESNDRESLTASSPPTDEDCQAAMDLAKQKPKYSLSDVVLRNWNAGSASFNMYMLENFMEMQDTTFTAGMQTKSEPSMVVDSNDMQSEAVKSVTASSSASDNHMYMFNNELSMTDTIFTMNVGSAGRRELQDMNFDINTLNINMYMCHNEMSMDITDFSMNINGEWSIPDSPDQMQTEMQGGNDQAVDLINLLFLTVLSLQQEASADSPDGMSVFEWMKDLADGQDSLDINMHMYNNKMSMTNTIFTWNVNQSPMESEVSEEEREAEANTKPRTFETRSRRQLSEDIKIRDSSMSMEQTTVTMNVGTENQVGLLGAGQNMMSVGELNIKMYMFANMMSMTDTTFVAIKN